MALPINLSQIQVTISSGTAVSPAVGLGAGTLVGIAMPGGWDTAGLTFQASPDGATFLNVQGASAELTYAAAAGEWIAVDPALWRGINEMKIRSGTGSVPVNQTADRIITLIVKPLA